MSLKSKIEAVIYASEEPVTFQQLTGLLAVEAQTEIDRLAETQTVLALVDASPDGAVEDVVPVHEAHEEGQEGALSKPVLDDPEVTASDAPMEVQQSISSPAASAELGIQAEEADKRKLREQERAVREHIRREVDELIRDYAQAERGIEIREVANGFRMGTKPEYHDAVRGFVKSLKPALKLTLQALETLAVVAYKQPVTAAEISEIRGVDSSGVLGGLLTRKMITTAGRKQVVGRPMLYRTTRDFLLRFGLKEIGDLPSVEEFERLAGELAEQDDLPMGGAASIIEQANARGDAEHIREANGAGSPWEGREGDPATAETRVDQRDSTDDEETTAVSAAERTDNGRDESAEAETIDPTKADGNTPSSGNA